MIKKLLRFGDIRLQQPAQKVEDFDTPQLHQLVTDLFDTMDAYGGVGIAAPQIGVSLQVIVFGFHKSERYPHAQPVPRTVLINPQYTPVGTEYYDDWEGCLSVRGIRGLVRRYQTILYSGQDIEGNTIEQQVTGFHAKLLQHEIDHLNGYLFIERIPNLKHLGFEQEIVQQMQEMGTKLS